MDSQILIFAYRKTDLNVFLYMIIIISVSKTSMIYISKILKIPVPHTISSMNKSINNSEAEIYPGNQKSYIPISKTIS